jgi:hypothetical protein
MKVCVVVSIISFQFIICEPKNLLVHVVLIGEKFDVFVEFKLDNFGCVLGFVTHSCFSSINSQLIMFLIYKIF